MTWSQVDRDELLRLSGHDPFVRFATSNEIVAVASACGWACVGPWRPGSAHWGGAAVVAPQSPPEAETQALAAILEAADGHADLEWFSTYDERSLTLPTRFSRTGSGRWSFMWTEQAQASPARPDARQGIRLSELDDRADAARLEAFGRAHGSQPYLGFPGRGLAPLWLGLVDAADEVVAIGALHELASGMPHLAGILVRPDLRGQGLGQWLTEALTARAVQEAGVATLSVFSDNARAIALYERLGYATAHRFHTRELAPAEPANTPCGV